MSLVGMSSRCCMETNLTVIYIHQKTKSKVAHLGAASPWPLQLKGNALPREVKGIQLPGTMEASPARVSVMGKGHGTRKE